jgi:hypothetical protein
LGERLLCKQEVIGSIPFTSTIAQQRGAMVCPGSRDSDIPGMSRKRAVQERIRSLDALLKRSRKIRFACNAPALPACSLTGEESVTEAGVSVPG